MFIGHQANTPDWTYHPSYQTPHLSYKPHMTYTGDRPPAYTTDLSWWWYRAEANRAGAVNYCPQCGAYLAGHVPAANFCPTCGTALAPYRARKYCPHCGKQWCSCGTCGPTPATTSANTDVNANDTQKSEGHDKCQNQK